MASWSGGSSITVGGNRRMGWFDTAVLAIGIVAANAVAFIPIDFFYPVTGEVCNTYHLCTPSPNRDAFDAWHRLGLFCLWVVLTSLVVAWRWRRVLVKVLVVQAVAVVALTINTIIIATSAHR